MTAPTPPTGAVAKEPRRLERNRGEVAEWRHADRLPALEVRMRAAGKFGGYPEQPATVRVSTFPGPLDGVTDPRELRQCAWLLLHAAAWLERQHPAQPEPAEPDPQTSVYDHVDTIRISL